MAVYRDLLEYRDPLEDLELDYDESMLEEEEDIATTSNTATTSKTKESETEKPSSSKTTSTTEMVKPTSRKRRTPKATQNKEKITKEQSIKKTFRCEAHTPKHIAPPQTKVLVKRLHPKSSIPRKASRKSAGFDVTTPDSVYIAPYGSKSVKTKIALQIPDGYYGRIACRSGLAREYRLIVLGGVIDSDYTGEIIVVLMNLGEFPIEMPEGTRIAQIIIEKIHKCAEMEEVENLGQTERGSKGFGSSGYHKL